VAAILNDSIDLLYCGEAPKPKWCASIARRGKAYNIEVDGNSVFIIAKLTNSSKSRATAAAMCADIAAANFDADAKPLGLDHFHVFDKNGDKELADCNRPGY